jgi:hypothetical protein
MLTLAEIGPALYGAWRLAHLDAGGMRYLDRSLDAFWRSFQVAVLAAPLWIVITAVQLAQMNATGGWFRVATAEAISYVISWVAFPLASFYISSFIDRERQYLGTIVALNWSQLLQLAFVLPVVLLMGSGLLPDPLAWLVGMAAQLALLIYEWFIIRTALNTTGLVAVGFVVLDFMIGRLLFGIVVAVGGVS